MTFAKDDYRTAIRSVLKKEPDFTLADILAAFAEAIEHRHAGIRACPDCQLKSQQGPGTCPQHEEDARRGYTYYCLRESFKHAPSNPDEFADISRIVLRPPGYDAARAREVEEILAALDIPPAGQVGSPPEPGGFIYVIGFSNGTVKVGRSRDLERRLATYRTESRRYGATVTDEWVSPQHAEWQRNETKLITIAHELGGTVAAGAEYFTGVAFADIIARAQDLPFTPSLEAAPA